MGAYGSCWAVAHEAGGKRRVAITGHREIQHFFGALSLTHVPCRHRKARPAIGCALCACALIDAPSYGRPCACVDIYSAFQDHVFPRVVLNDQRIARHTVDAHWEVPVVLTVAVSASANVD